MKGAFSGANETYSYCLVRAVFEDLSNPGSLYTPHAFLCGVELPKFSLSVTLSHVQDCVVRDLQEQCTLILDQGLKKVIQLNNHSSLPGINFINLAVKTRGPRILKQPTLRLLFTTSWPMRWEYLATVPVKLFMFDCIAPFVLALLAPDTEIWASGFVRNAQGHSGVIQCI